MLKAADIRFYAELNDFLAPDRRQRDVRYAFGVGQSVKDAIEALGVPHTEVSLILVNGDSADFAHRLADGDRVSVYPAFETFDVSGASRVGPEPLRSPRFVADTHLGKLARYLRVLGFDTHFGSDANDDALARLSCVEDRVLITRDRGLLKRRIVTHGLFIRDEDPKEQLLDVIRRLHLGAWLRPFTRCMACNGVVEVVDKAEIVERLEPATRRHFEAFRRCANCGRVYWEGSHYRRLLALVRGVRDVGDPIPPGATPPEGADRTGGEAGRLGTFVLSTSHRSTLSSGQRSRDARDGL